MLLDRGAYLSAEGNFEGVSMALERIWLDWQSKRLIESIWKPIGVNQAVNTILAQVDAIPSKL
jgi:hypothetical protein